MNTAVLTERIVARRDSATAILKKLGVAKANYDRFIRAADGSFVVSYDAAVIHVANGRANGHVVRGAASMRDDLDETNSLAAAKAEKSSSKRTVTSVAEALIRSGKSNADVWTALVAEFSLDAKKRGYPAWYRRHLKIAKGEDYPEPKAAA